MLFAVGSVTHSVSRPPILGPAVMRVELHVGQHAAEQRDRAGRRDAADEPVGVVGEPDVAVARRGDAAEEREGARQAGAVERDVVPVAGSTLPIAGPPKPFFANHTLPSAPVDASRTIDAADEPLVVNSVIVAGLA